ncbi:tetratricopeptide repeat protein [Oceanidesulfovibrio marinus]|uniref:Tetratricopeptide repeat-containing protein n=1 Tax=Oceanidesulfovibrio marinus TaxID=370038 RepID=A0ABX6NIA1_9BACT|nr:hypothetical protein [Oceanidesulfovibrio marinus]QJT10312.1 hypothetical protein E8L03_15845 [Oceanidesulfovibrio marinus]
MRYACAALLALWCLAFFCTEDARCETLSEAMNDVLTQVEEHPDDPEAQKRAGMGYLYLAREVGDDPSRDVFGSLADFHLDQAAQLDPDDDETLTMLAETAVLNQDPYKAANVYEILVGRQEDPAEGRYLVPLQSCYQWLMDPWRAVSFYRSQLERMPAWPQLEFLLAVTLLDIDRGEALEIMWKLAGSPDTPPELKKTVRAAIREES